MLPMPIVGVLDLYLVWSVLKQVSIQDNSTEFQINNNACKGNFVWKDTNVYRITSVLKVETYIIICIPASPKDRDVILVIMHAITFKAASILFIGVTGHHVTLHSPIFSSIRVTKLILVISFSAIEANMPNLPRGRNGRDRMEVGYTTICAISDYHRYDCEFESR